MTARARSQRRVTGSVTPVRSASRPLAPRPPRPVAPRQPKQTPDFGAGVIASVEQEAAQDGFLRTRLASPVAVFMVGALGYAVFEIFAAMFMAR